MKDKLLLQAAQFRQEVSYGDGEKQDFTSFAGQLCNAGNYSNKEVAAIY